MRFHRAMRAAPLLLVPALSAARADAPRVDGGPEGGDD
jgi:hypothetical protein